MNVVAIDPSRSGETLVLVSRNVEGHYGARRIYDPEIDEGIYSSATIPASEAVLAEFRRTHVIAAGDPLIAFPVRTPGEREAIEKFFAHCDGAGRQPESKTRSILDGPSRSLQELTEVRRRKDEMLHLACRGIENCMSCAALC